ncbi:hypothetical protein ES288_A11G041200v1 [Gossypium darwinii]|uniref:Uncharacterized protein n=1 Tax=Gossypium darwinii TaxID=34276 RepID=A0A5D2EH57_GOSDA|nr:hypothetical protein ES288_A11G041200v1 [Gossypium darwinii]
MAVKEIEVRTLSGESTTITVSPETTINDLKHLLKLSFAPATSSPNFHLFFKGTKLNLQCKVSSLAFQSGEFFVLIPFTKKNKPQVENPSFSNDASAATSFSDSTYSHMMQEFSYLRDNSRKFSEGNNNNSNGHGDDDDDDSFKSRRKQGGNIDKDERNEGHPYDLLWNVLRSSDRDLFEEKNCEKFVEVLQSMNCLSSPYSGKCMLLSEAIFRTSDDHASCLCPTWLRGLVEAFALLSILWAFLQLQAERMTTSRLKQVLGHLEQFGVGICMEDIEHLSVLCPKVVYFVNNDMEPKNFSDALVITHSSTKEADKFASKLGAGKTCRSLSKIFNLMKKWESSFKTSLWETIKLLMVIMGNEAKRARRSSSCFEFSVKRRCHQDTSQLLPSEMVEHLRKSIGSGGQMVHVEKLVLGKVPMWRYLMNLRQSKSALKSIGINKLYSHQAESLLASLSGKNGVVATMTSSGKSVCYNLPVLEALSHNFSSCAFTCFPQRSTKSFVNLDKWVDCGIILGYMMVILLRKKGTWLQENARLIDHNPDMLHMAILPLHRQFIFVLIDEAHAYKGAFGCHTALILRRLRRLCSHAYGSDPSFVFCTATSSNPIEHCMELANLSTLELIEKDGSPSSEKFFVLWNPTLPLRTIKVSFGIDGRNASDKSLSPISEVSHLFAEMVQHGLRCIAFCKSRWLPTLSIPYVPYRAGYISEDRRRIESEFFGGKLCGIAATNALELGIDVGHIDVTLHLGFPGSIASLWQQAGRSGRRERSSLAVYVAFEGPLDQYFMKFPQKYSVRILTSNPSNDSLSKIWSYMGHEKRPSRSISIRAIEAERYIVIDKQLNETLEEIEESRAFFQVYEGAVYLPPRRTYLDEEFGLSRKLLITRDYTDIHIVGGKIVSLSRRVSKDQLPKTTAQANPCSVTTTWFGFRRIRRGSNQVFGHCDLSLPRYSYESQAVWISKKYSFRAGLHAACHAVLHVVPLYMRCNLSDLAPECPNPYDSRFFPERILLYDQHPGGTGVSKQIQPYFTELLHSALELLTCCHCSSDTGCPNCVQNLACQEYNELINKDAAIVIIKGVLDAEKTYFEGHSDSTPSC